MMKRCSADCPSFRENPQTGFHHYRIKAGETFTLEASDTNHMFFLLSGCCTVDSEERTDYLLREDHFVFCYFRYTYTFTCIEEAEVVVARFITPGTACEMMHLSDTLERLKTINYRFTSVKVNEPLRLLLRGVTHYLVDGITCNHMQHSKIEELFIVFKFYYPEEVQLRTFYNIFDRSLSFSSLVENNAPLVRTVEELAQLSGYSLKHFMSLFKQYYNETPYQWLQKRRAPEIQHLLCDSSTPLKNIIKKYGFSSSGHFSLYCRKYLGNTPLKIRNQAKRERLAAEEKR